MSMRAFVSTSLPVPPAVTHWAAQSGEWAALENIYANDQLGDCTAAAAGHLLALWRGLSKSGEPAPTTAQVVDFYSRTTGYNPADPNTDQGGDEITVLNDWMKSGFFSDGSGKIAGWGNVVGSDPILLAKQCIWLFGGLYFGVELPDAWVDQSNQKGFGSGFVWDAAGDPDPNNGHAFIGVDYNDVGIQIDTWGLFGTMTWAAVEKYALNTAGGEMHAVFSQEMISAASQKAPNGFDAQALQDYLASGFAQG